MTDDDRLGPPPVEPLSDAAWSRVERGIWQRMDTAGPMPAAPTPPSRRWWLIAAPLAAAAAAAVILIGLPRTPDGVDEPARVVSRTSPTAVTFGESHIELDPQTALAMNRESGRPTVLLERGAAWFTVAPRVRQPEFVVRAGDAMVRVVGTRFRVARSEERITVEVEHGLVNVQFRGREVAIGENQRWSSAAPAQISALVGRSPAAEPVITPAQPEDDPLIEMPVAEPKPTRPARRDARPEPRKADADVDAKLSRASDDLERIEYERLASLEPTRPEAALTGYMTLARGTSRWADLALFAAARLAADRHDRRAETLLGIYLQRFPNGANAADAKQLLSRLKAEHPLEKDR